MLEPGSLAGYFIIAGAIIIAAFIISEGISGGLKKIASAIRKIDDNDPTKEELPDPRFLPSFARHLYARQVKKSKILPFQRNKQ
jgi:hypothetical protein